ncbi:MAG: sodium:solute symporter family protein [Deltaproteobacteria bacterium]|jgi:SSS family solute:Na+ symporter|nr:sodium:solute symporter family protein [Deltaproteobacteria bacterium]
MKNIIPLTIVVVYMVVLYSVAWYSTKLSQGGAKGFFLANRGFPVGIIAVMVCGMAVGGASTVGVAQNAYTNGLSAGMYNAAWGAGAIICGLVLAKRMRNMTVYTLTEFLGHFYGPGARFIGVVGQLIVMLTIVSLQYVAGGAVLTALLPEYFTFNSGMLFTAAAFVGICLIGGYWAAGLSNLINVIVIYIGLIIGAVTLVSASGGLAAMNTALPDAKWFSFTEGMGLFPIITWFTVMITQAQSTQGVIQIGFAAKDGPTASKGFILAGLLILPAGFISAIFGITAAIQFPGLANSVEALPKVVLSTSPIIAGFVLAGLWAADVSTAVGLLLGCATMILRDIINPIQKKERTKKEEMLVSRALVLVVAFITFFMALQVRSVLGTIMIGLSLTAPFTLTLLTTFYTPQLCRKSSAFWCLVVGVLAIFMWQFAPGDIRAFLRDTFRHLIYLEWLACIVTFFVVALVDKHKCPIPEGYGLKEMKEIDA